MGTRDRLRCLYVHVLGDAHAALAIATKTPDRVIRYRPTTVVVGGRDEPIACVLCDTDE